MQIYRCNGLTSSGERCKRNVKGGSFCHDHVPKFLQEKPDECIVCFDPLDKQEYPQRCGHWIHTECIIQSAKSECPLCRQPITLSPEDKKKLDELAEIRKQEQIESDEEQLLQLIDSQLEEVIMTEIIRQIITSVPANEHSDEVFFLAQLLGII